VGCLRRAEGATLAAALHQTAVLVDDHPLPTHDAVAWRAAVAAFRGLPDSELYRREAVRRTLFSTPYVQVFRSWGNLFLYAALVLLSTGRRAPPTLLLLGPLSVSLLVPGVGLHALANVLVWLLSRLLGGRVARRLTERPEDEPLLDDLEAIVARGVAGGKAQ